LKSLKSIFETTENDSEGTGGNRKARMIIKNKYCKDLDPFLLFVIEKLKLPSGGFPDHPHRGIETLSYIWQGEVSHEDSTGKKGFLKTGSMQWMTSGKGILHSEMPTSFDHFTESS